MSKHIEEAMKLETYGWVVKLKGSCKVGSFFVYEPNFDYLEGWDRKDYEVEPLVRLSDAQAAIAAAEERGRMEERERDREAIRKAGLKARDEVVEGLAGDGSPDNDLADYLERIVDACANAITKEPTP